MRNLVNLFIVLIFVFQSVTTQAQNTKAKMVFDKKNHNFGKIKEDGGNVEHKYVFTNTGAEAIVIQNVKTSCGCTTPDWTRKPIPPGEKGFVNAVYDPLRRVGKFDKSVTVVSNAENSPVELRLRGEVIGKKVNVEEEYRHNFDGVRFKKTSLHFTPLYRVFDKTNNASKEKGKNVQEIKIINTNSVPARLTFNSQRRVPKHLRIRVVPSTLKPNQKGKIIFTYDPDKKNGWDYVHDRLNVSVNGEQNSRNRITISATIKELFTDKQIANPPTMDFINGTEFKFGNIKQGDKVEHVFKFKNNGKSDLAIRKTKAACGCTAIAPQDKIIKPGQESSIKAVFNSRGKKGKQNKTITVITNIPGKIGRVDNNKIILKVTGNVEVPEKKENSNKK